MEVRFTFSRPPGGPPRVEKRGDGAAIAREAEALRAVAGRPWAPVLIAEGPGVLVTGREPGGPRDLAAMPAADARRLGAALRELHDLRTETVGGLWWWTGRAHSLRDYRDGRVADAERALDGTAGEGLAAAAARAAPAPPDGRRPFRLLHGDLVGANVLWPRGRPVLIDWEFHRLGDPAEDLAYLAELNALPGAVLRAVLAGYGRRGMAARVDSWRAIVAADAAGWYLAEGMDADARRLLARAAVVVHGENPPAHFSSLCPKPSPGARA